MVKSKPESSQRESLLQSIPGYLPGNPLPPPKPIEQHAKESAAAIREAVAPGGKLKPEQAFLPFAPMPTELCRVSPFFPMSKNEMATRTFVQDLVITKSSWGEISYTGEKLSIYEEDALLALLAILDAMRREKEAYIYEGPALPILKLMGYEKPGKVEYQRLEAAFQRMAGARFTMFIKDVIRTTENIVSRIAVDQKTRNFVVALNPYFAEQYLAGTVTLLDVVQRRRLKKPTSKSLYRFMSSHRNPEWKGHFLTLASALNLNVEQPHFEIRRQIKDAVAELKKHGMLEASSGFIRGSKEVIRLIRSTGRKPALK